MNRRKTTLNHVLILLAVIPLGYFSVSVNFFDPLITDDKESAPDYFTKAESLIISQQEKRSSGTPESWDTILPLPFHEIFLLWMLTIVIGLYFPTYSRQARLSAQSRAPPFCTPSFIP